MSNDNVAANEDWSQGWPGEQRINVSQSVTVNTPAQSRGAGTVLMFLFCWWLLLAWWTLLLSAWIVWLPIAGIVTIFKHGFFTATWYQPWPAWMLGIR